MHFDHFDQSADGDGLGSIGKVTAIPRSLLGQRKRWIGGGDVRRAINPVAVFVDHLQPFIAVADVVSGGDGSAQIERSFRPADGSR